MTRDEWIRTCVSEIRRLTDCDWITASASGNACADAQEEEKGLDTTKWTLPEEVAVEEVSYWDDDGDR